MSKEEQLTIYKPTAHRVDSTNAQEMAKAFAEIQLQLLLIVDLSDTFFISSAGMREIISERKRRKAGGGRLAVVVKEKDPESCSVFRTFSLAGLDSFLNIFSSIPDAQSYLMSEES
jgi:anti-anti-sigma factor